MNELQLPWLELSLAAPFVGAVVVALSRDPQHANQRAVLFSALTLAFTVGAWFDFEFLGVPIAADHGHLPLRLFGRECLVIDELSAPLMPLAALLHFLTALTTGRTKLRRFPFSGALFSEALLLATFSFQEQWAMVALAAASTVLPYFELRARNRPTAVYAVHMFLFVALLSLGWALVELSGVHRGLRAGAVVALLAAILIRGGMVPFHCWVTDLYEHATLGTALLFTTPVVSAYLAMRLVLPIAPDFVLGGMGLAALATAVYAAGITLIQRDARRFFCFLLLSHSALVLAGLELATPLGLTGALCVWLSVGLGMGGYGLTLRALEARLGRLSLVDFQGLYDHTPNLAMCFMLTGLTSVGFPGTFGFIGTELLVDGAVEAHFYHGAAVVLAAALDGIAVVKAYFLLFSGRRHVSSVSLKIRVRERYAVLALAALILLGGFFPQAGVTSRHRAAQELLEARRRLAADVSALAGTR